VTAGGNEDTDVDDTQIILGILVWLAILGVALFLMPGGGGRAQVGAWFVLTMLTVAVLFIVVFLVSYGLLFFVGKEAAGVGVVLGVVAIAVTPIAWALVLRGRARQKAAAPDSTAGGKSAG
jgi:hypothetical protein